MVVNNSAGSPTDNNSGAADTAESQQLDLDQKINNIVHAALGKRLSSFESKIMSVLQNSGSQPKQQVEQEEEPTTNKDRIARLENELKREREERASERETARQMKLKNETADALRKAGVKPEHIKAVSALLITEDRKVQIDKLGNITFAGEYEGDSVPLMEGITSWVKNGEGKVFLDQPKVPRASNDTRQYKGASVSSQQSSETRTIEELDAEILESARNMFGI
jgi:hypothetical protein